MQNENSDMPNGVKVFMTVFNRLGFPVMVSIWLAYQQFISGKETVKALQEFKEVMVQVKDSIDTQNRLLRHRSRNDQ